MSRCQILNKHTIADMVCSKWTSHRISHLGLRLWCEIVLRNPFSQNKSTIVYIYAYNVSLVLLEGKKKKI